MPGGSSQQETRVRGFLAVYEKMWYKIIESEVV